MLRNKRTAASFKTKLLGAFLVSYVLLWSVFIGLLLFSERSNLVQLIDSQRAILTIYARSLTNDLRLGNLQSVEKRLHLLVRENILSELILDAADDRIRVEKDDLDGAPHPHRHSTLWPILKLQTMFTIPILDSNASKWGSLTIVLDPDFLLEPVEKAMRNLSIVCISLFLVLLGILMLIIDSRSQPITSLVSYIRSFSNTKYNEETMQTLLNEPVFFGVKELDLLREEFKKSVANIIELQKEIQERSLRDELNKVALQVAHDIRSPLAALEVVTSSLEQLPDDESVLIRSAISRMREIANDLLERTRRSHLGEGELGPVSDWSIEQISSLISSVVSEKRVQNPHFDRGRIVFQPRPDHFGIFARVRPAEFKRVISNLISNAQDASKASSPIEIECLRIGEQVHVAVVDHGKGIAAAILPKLAQRGATFEKRDGSGLGLYHARLTAEEMGGQMEIFSKVGKGTRVELSFPASPPPKWLASGIVVWPETHIVILDDEEAIYHVWKTRFREVPWEVPLLHFSSAEGIFSWHRNRDPLDHVGFLYLVDYDLRDKRVKGTDVIRQLGIETSAILVTSHFDDPNLQSHCAARGIKILPKTMSALIPIKAIRRRSETTAYLPPGRPTSEGPSEEIS